MTLRPSTATLIGGAMLAAVLAPAGTAYAATVDVTDATSDVWESATGDGVYVASDEVNNLDVTSLKVRHLTNRIVVTAAYVELKREGVPLALMSRLRFDDGPVVMAQVDTFHRWSGDSVLHTKRDEINCGRFEHAIDYEANTVELNVPRGCVGGPRWVEVNYVSSGFVEDPDVESGYRSYRDNALNAGSSTGGWTDRVRRG